MRIPASYCGILVLRPTWGRVSLREAVPFGPSFDVAGWFARDADILEKVGRVLLGDSEAASRPERLLVARDAFALVERAASAALAPALARLEGLIGKGREVEVAPGGLVAWFETFRTIQAAEVWASVGAGVNEVKPRLGPGVKERIEWAATVTPDMLARANARRAEARARMDQLLGPGDVLCLPTSPRAAPPLGTPVDKIEIEYRNQAMCLLCIAGLAGLRNCRCRWRRSTDGRSASPLSAGREPSTDAAGAGGAGCDVGRNNPRLDPGALRRCMASGKSAQAPADAYCALQLLQETRQPRQPQADAREVDAQQQADDLQGDERIHAPNTSLMVTPGGAVPFM